MIRCAGSSALRRSVAASITVLLVFAITLASAGAAEPATPAATPAQAAPSPFPANGSDGFESGNLDGWTFVGAKTQKKYVADGKFAVRVTAAKRPAFLSRSLATPQKDLTAHIAVKILSRDNNPVPLLQLQSASGAMVVMLFTDKDGHLAVQLGSHGAVLTSDAVVADKKWHTLDVYVRLGSHGSVDVALDGAAVPALSGSRSLTSTPIGVLASGATSSKHAFDVVFDSVSVVKGRAKAMAQSPAQAPSVRAAAVVSTPAATTVTRYNDPVLQWLPEIIAASNATGVPPSLIAGVMALESSGNPSTVSVAGAVGLMQVMPDELAAHGSSVAAGFNPATNVMIGARILAERSGAGWELATGYYFGVGCDAYGTCTAAYVRAALAWAAAYAPALGDPFRGDPSVIPASWEMSPATESAAPTRVPGETATPSSTPTTAPTTKAAPTETPTPPATDEPTKQPTAPPTATPTDVPTEIPTKAPTEIPTEAPTEIPTEAPTGIPIDSPTDVPTNQPTDIPTTDATQTPG